MSQKIKRNPQGKRGARRHRLKEKNCSFASLRLCSLALNPFKERDFRSSKNVFQKGDVLYGKLRPNLDKVIVADEAGVCSSEIVPIRCYTDDIHPFYLRWALKRSDFLEYVINKTYGTKMPRLGTQDAMMALIPLPPPAEQQRIVEKMEALLALCEAVQAGLVAAEAARQRVAGVVVA